MKTIGRVIKTEENIATVALLRKTSCGKSCEKCGLCGKEELYITVKNDIGAQAGSAVQIAFEDKVPLGLAFLIYILPIFLAFGAYFLFNALWGYIAGIIGTLLAIGVWIFLIVKVNKKVSADNKYNGVIVEIIS